MECLNEQKAGPARTSSSTKLQCFLLLLAQFSELVSLLPSARRYHNAAHDHSDPRRRRALRSVWCLCSARTRKSLRSLFALGLRGAHLGWQLTQGVSTIWQPTATVVVTNTYTGTRVEQIWTTVPPYEWETTFPITWTATETQTLYKPVPTNVPRENDERRHARDFQQS